MSENLGGRETGSEHACKEKSFSEHVRDLPVTLYLFGRTGREKEEWFHHFLIAAKDTEMEKQHSGRCVSRSGMRTLSNCIRAVLSYMHVWIMDYVLQFFAFQALTRVDSGPCRHTTAHFKLIWKVFCHNFLYNPGVSYTLPGDAASALNSSSASHLLRSVASSTEGNIYDADDPSPLAPESCAAHVSKPSATPKVLSVLDYHPYMTHLLAIEETTPLSSPGASSLETSPTIKGSVSQA